MSNTPEPNQPASLAIAATLNEAPVVRCPAVHVPDVTPCDLAELRPLLDFLRASASAEPRPEPDEAIFFPRGAILPGGRLDACKQSLGPRGCRSLAAALESAGHIRAILLGTGAIGDEGAANVARLISRSATLETVYLGCNAITSRGTQVLAEAVAQSPSVRGLWLKRNPIGESGVAHLAAMLERNEILSTLDIVNCGFEPAALAPLCLALEGRNRSLRRLYAGGNGLGSQQAASLARVLEANSGLEALLLSSGHIGDEGAACLGRGLAQNSSLRELGLGSNGLGAHGAASICQAAAEHPALEVLDLGRATSQSALGAPPNVLGSGGARAVAGMLRSNLSLRRLGLRGAGIAREGAEEIFEAAALHPALSELHLDLPLPPAVREALARNRQRLGELAVGDEVAAIRSVYRTARGESAST